MSRRLPYFTEVLEMNYLIRVLGVGVDQIY